MKVLRVNAYFELPDDFEGSFEEALTLFLGKFNSPLPVIPSEDPSFNITSEAFEVNRYRGFTCLAETGVWSLNDGELWKRLDKNPPNCHSNKNGLAWVK